MVPQKAGEHVVDYGAIAISDVQNPNTVQYCEIQIHIEVFEKYYLKLYPASFFKRTADGINTYDLRIDTYSKEEDMVRNGWMRFDNFEEMEEAAKTVKQPEDLRDMVIRASYELNLKG